MSQRASLVETLTREVFEMPATALFQDGSISNLGDPLFIPGWNLSDPLCRGSPIESTPSPRRIAARLGKLGKFVGLSLSYGGAVMSAVQLGGSRGVICRLRGQRRCRAFPARNSRGSPSVRHCWPHAPCWWDQGASRGHFTMNLVCTREKMSPIGVARQPGSGYGSLALPRLLGRQERSAGAQLRDGGALDSAVQVAGITRSLCPTDRTSAKLQNNGVLTAILRRGFCFLKCWPREQAQEMAESSEERWGGFGRAGAASPRSRCPPRRLLSKRRTFGLSSFPLSNDRPLQECDAPRRLTELTYSVQGFCARRPPRMYAVHTQSKSTAGTRAEGLSIRPALAL